MSAYEAAVGSLLSGMAQAAASDDDDRSAGAGTHGLVRLDRALGAYLDALAAEPAFARLFLLEIYAAGPAAMERRAASQRQVIDLVGALLQADTDEQRFVAEAFVAATISLVTTRIAANDLDGLRALRGPLIGLAARLSPGG